MTSPTFVNMTPHEITVLNPRALAGSREEVLVIPPSGETIRLDQTDEMVDDLMIDGTQIEIIHTVFESAGSLPEVIPGTYYIVSAIVAKAYPERHDFLIVARTIRGEDGRIDGCTAFARVTRYPQPLVG